jgi:outer membrane protein assembly factor BamB
MTMKGYLMGEAMIICAMICTVGCTGQDIPNEDQGTFYLSSGGPLSFGTHTLIAEENHLYALSGSLFCFDWKGNLVWESQNLGSGYGIFLGNAFFIDTYNKSIKQGGIAFLNQDGQVLWQMETEIISEAGFGASERLLAAGSIKGVLYAFSRTGSLLWTYSDTYAPIEQVAVAPGRSRVVFIDLDGVIKCVSDKRLMWKKEIGSPPYVASSRTLAFAPDCSCLVYGSQIDDPCIVASTLNGNQLWSSRIDAPLRSVAITQDSQYIIAACSKYIYKFMSDGTLVWKRNIGKDNIHIAITPEADYIAFGSEESFSSRILVLNGEGEVLWTGTCPDRVFAVAISLTGKYVAFSSRQGKTYIFSRSDVV